MTAVSNKTTLDDIAKSIDIMQTQIDDIQTQMVTIDELSTSISG